MSPHFFATCDLGAESGRVMLGRLEEGKIQLEEVHRFANGPVRVMGGLRWDVLKIYDELKTGLRKIGEVDVSGVSVDSWGVDYVLYRKGQPMVSVPYHYRDARTDASFPMVLGAIGKGRIFAETGIQFMPFNTIYQLVSDLTFNAPALDISDGFLLIADYLNYLFSGVARAEESLASTTQLYGATSRQWSEGIIKELALPRRIFPEVVQSGTVLGPLAGDVVREIGLNGASVVAGCSHDTAAAVAAVPATEGDDWAYLSSGTWSLLGVELDKPLISPEIQELNYTNEIGYGGRIRFLRNIIGLWILQECRREWAREGEDWDYAELVRAADAAEPMRSLIHPNSPLFVKPGGMPARVVSYCRQTSQPEPATVGQFARCILESLALLYGETLDQLAELTGRTINRLHIVGGGGRNALLNQFAANATGRCVLAGPVEATALGNALVQAIALGHLSSLEELRATVARSFAPVEYVPGDRAAWGKARERFAQLPLLD